MPFDIRLLSSSSATLPNGTIHPRVIRYSTQGHNYVMGTGLVPLVQSFLSNLLTDPGSDKLDPNRGGGILGLGQRYRAVTDDLRREVARRIKVVERAMLDEQETLAFSSDETLISVEILAIEKGITSDEIVISLVLRAASGSNYLLSL